MNCFQSKPRIGARKSFLKGVSTTEQHDKQKTMINTIRVNTRRSDSGQQSNAAESLIQMKNTNVANTPVGNDRARKTFAMPFPPNSADKTAVPHSEPLSSQDESSTHSTSGTAPKRRRRHYKGGTYGLFLSKKRKKLRENAKKAKENDIKTNETNAINPEGEESSQSFAANSESDRDLEGESSDLSNDEHEAEHNEEQPQQVNEEHKEWDV